MAQTHEPTHYQAPILTQGPGWVVLNKPAGLASHPGRRGCASAEDFFPQLSRRKDGPWLAHRLDADTAGCLLVALRKSVLLAAQASFAAGTAAKIYWAVVEGAPKAVAGMIEAPLARVTDPHGWHIAVSDRGVRAVTEWRVRGTSGGLTWLELRPRTGRTHQLRVHCRWLGTPILGDPRYGHPGGGLLLLARSLHLAITPPIAAEAPPPPHMQAPLAACGFY